MIKLDLTTRSHLREIQRRNGSKDIYVKVTTLLMLDKGLSPAQVADMLGVDGSTIYRYQKKYQEEGLKKYLSVNYRAYGGKLSTAEENILKAELVQYLYISSKEVVDYIERTFGKHYTPNGVVKLLHRLGFVYKKTKTIPSKANGDHQRAFVKELEDLLFALKANEILYFNDATHPLHNTRPDYGWILKGSDVELPANTGRKRMNLNGCLNALDVTDVMVREDERINAQSTIKLWEAQRRRHPDKTIYNIVDNAPYYRSRVLQEWLEDNSWCKVIYLPSYSPNLNLIERLWKFLRKEVTSYYYYEHFEDFRRAVLKFFRNIREYEEQLESLLTLNFHIPDTA